ncbi:transmembrane protein 80-like isoform X2 [Neolamprologus brichardi]|uniref:transmembrane protein 80-like isoform X2 n=1 Tax=Neolamprologus brichardi TaxID=32507 RepID=UPI001643D730|nr:transmembrane protein 80-like isoform X2 [Neolamprologus brichardi]
MALPRPGRPAGVLSSVTLQLLLHVTAAYFVFYFVFTLGLIIKKSLVLSYPSDALVCDIVLLFLLAALEFLHFYSGATILLTVYFLVWQSYVMRADVIISSVSLGLYGLDGVLAFSTLTKFARVHS